MKSGQAFSDYLADKVDLPAGIGLMDTSEAYLERYGSVVLVGELLMEFTASALLPHQIAMASVPWKHIYTTNYDDVVEKAYKSKQLSIASLNPATPVSATPHGESICVHLNGSIIGLNSANLAAQVRLTDSSYLTSALSESEWSIRLRQDIDAAQAVFYVGYSTYDLDIARLLFAKPSLKDKSFFAVGTSPSAILRRRIEKFGTDTALGAAELFEEMLKAAYAPSGNTPVLEACIKTYAPAPATRAFSDRDLFDLFMVGRLVEPFIFESITGQIKYVAHRKHLDKVMSLLEMTYSAISVNSSLGNGKTVFLQMVKVQAAIRGHTVIELTRHKDSLYEELEKALKRDNKIVLVIDNYGDWQEAIKYIGKHHSKNLSVILAARTGTNDVLASRMQSYLDLGELYEISLDKLHDDDLVKISAMIDAYGLWGDKASWALRRKLQHLTNYCGREWHAILIELFKSPQIKDRLDRLITGINNEKTYSSVLIAILILAIVDHPATTDTLTDLCGETTLTIGFRQNPVIQELISFEQDDVRLKSAVTGAFILKQVADPELTLESLKAITRAADHAASVSSEYFSILSALMRFGNAQNFFPDEVSNSFVIRYYEAMKDLRQCKRYPLFWLQYAIACLFNHDFEMAGAFFASAYSFAKQSNFRTSKLTTTTRAICFSGAFMTVLPRSQWMRLGVHRN